MSRVALTCVVATADGVAHAATVSESELLVVLTRVLDENSLERRSAHGLERAPDEQAPRMPDTLPPTPMDSSISSSSQRSGMDLAVDESWSKSAPLAPQTHRGAIPPSRGTVATSARTAATEIACAQCVGGAALVAQAENRSIGTSEARQKLRNLRGAGRCTCGLRLVPSWSDIAAPEAPLLRERAVHADTHMAGVSTPEGYYGERDMRLGGIQSPPFESSSNNA